MSEVADDVGVTGSTAGGVTKEECSSLGMLPDYRCSFPAGRTGHTLSYFHPQ
jgi:hypothetical protein